MSSILDALNKLEEEKKEAARTAAEAAIDARVAARELVGRSGNRRHSHASPLVWGLAGIAIFSTITFGAAGAAYFMLRPTLPASPIAAVTPAGAGEVAALGAAVSPEEPAAGVPGGGAERADTEVPPVQTPVATAPATSERANSSLPETEPAKTDAAKPAVSVAKAPSAERALPESFDVASNALPDLSWVGDAAKASNGTARVAAPVSEANQPRGSVESSPLPAPAALRDEPAAPVSSSTATSPAPLPGDLSKLPILRESDKARLGFEKVNINMLQPKTSTRPYARAIINLKPVLIGERISETRTMLIGVETNGIAIEVSGSRERYFVPFGYGR